MCNHFNVRCILFTGVAGGLQEGQQIGDLVLGAEVVNHDMDCTGFVMGPKTHVLGEIPFVGWRFYEADKAMLELAQVLQPLTLTLALALALTPTLTLTLTPTPTRTLTLTLTPTLSAGVGAARRRARQHGQARVRLGLHQQRGGQARFQRHEGRGAGQPGRSGDGERGGGADLQGVRQTLPLAPRPLGPAQGRRQR